MKFLFLCLFLTGISAGQLCSQTSVPPALQSKYPGLKVEIKITKKRDTKWKHGNNILICPTVFVEGSPKHAMGEIEATVLTITEQVLGSRVIVDREVRKKDPDILVLERETVKIPAVANGATREFSFPPGRVIPNENVTSGQLYLCYILALRDPASKELLHFETDCRKINAELATKPELRETLSQLTKSARLDPKYK